MLFIFYQMGETKEDNLMGYLVVQFNYALFVIGFSNLPFWIEAWFDYLQND